MSTKISVSFCLGFGREKSTGCKAQENGFPETFCDFLSFSFMNVTIDVARVGQFVVVNLYKLVRNFLPLCAVKVW